MTLKYNDFVYRWVYCYARGRMILKFQTGHVIYDSPEDKDSVAVWWNKYAGKKEAVRKNTLTVWSENDPELIGVEEYIDEPRKPE